VRADGTRGELRGRPALKIDELTDVQNACLEAAQEAAIATDRSSLINADDVVAHVTKALDHGGTATIARLVSRAQASRALQQLNAWKILRREPRSSQGWGRGWHPAFYALNETVHS